jgi:hypothetical protein
VLDSFFPAIEILRTNEVESMSWTPFVLSIRQCFESLNILQHVYLLAHFETVKNYKPM